MGNIFYFYSKQFLLIGIFKFSEQFGWGIVMPRALASVHSGSCVQFKFPQQFRFVSQFYLTIQSPSGDVDTSPVEFIPNCIKQITPKCHRDFPLHIRIQSEFANQKQWDFFDFGQIYIDMYVLTWPLPTQSPYGEQSEDVSTSGGIAAEYGTTAEKAEDRDQVKELAELFLANEVGEKLEELPLKGRKSGCINLGNKMKLPNRRSNDDELIFERKVEMLRQIPTEERRLLRKLQRNIQKMLKTE